MPRRMVVDGSEGAFWHSNPYDGILVQFPGHPCVR